MTATGLDRIDGSRLSLRLAMPSDATYIHSLRVNPRYNTFLSTVSGTAEDQRAWIERYKTREALGTEYYYVIERCSDATPCGLVRLYNIENKQFTWGSWILDENKPAKAALESAVLIYRIGFEHLGLSISRFDVRADNQRTLAFHDRFGARKTGSNEQDVFFEYSKTQFMRDRAKHEKAYMSG
ncbi:GNAT family N-acetyltransferase [uncultured Roseobacter sp.]|uniref:GNAT family N-acetyltransferase n=1 Tax=uncultured Roseobacter sp. TaxID=114847 RepID=UPI002626F876|nr:GNAT family N-acetyltransferase [uncultured Roseobacter sp.]